MPKILVVKLHVPSGSRAEKMKIFLSALLSSHRMTVLSVEEETTTQEIKRFQDGKAKPFLSAAEYDDLRDDDKFLFNRSDS